MLCVVTENQTLQAKETTIFIRKTKSRKYGTYYQLVRSYRDDAGKPRQRMLVHLGEHPTPEAAMAAWPVEIEKHSAAGRHQQQSKLQSKLDTLQGLVGREERNGKTQR